jgi:hypothetical protein
MMQDVSMGAPMKLTKFADSTFVCVGVLFGLHMDKRADA